MKRKINRVGQNTLTVSLPSKWAQKHNLKPGQEIDVDEEGKSLVLNVKKGVKRAKKARLNLDGLSHVTINRFIDEFYRQGVEEITLKFAKETIKNFKKNKDVEVDKHIRNIARRYIGLEVISKTSDKIVLQSIITKEESEKIEVVEKRVYFLIKDLIDEFIKALDGDFSKFHDKVYDYHDNIAKFSNYYFRLLNFSDLSDEKKSRLFGLFIVIDKIIDKIRHASERVDEMKKITDKIKKYIKEIYLIFLEQFDMILKKGYSVEELTDLIKRRYSLVKKVNSEKFKDDEIKVISECNLLLNAVNDFTEAYVALNIDKYVSEE